MIRDPLPLVTNTEDPEQAELAARLVDDQSDRDAALWQAQLSTYEGREFLYTCVLSPLPGYQDITGPTEGVYRELGRRDVWLALMRRVAAFPEFRFQMEKEALARAKQRSSTIAAQRAGRARVGGDR